MWAEHISSQMIREGGFIQFQSVPGSTRGEGETNENPPISSFRSNLGFRVASVSLRMGGVDSRPMTLEVKIF